MVSLMVRDRVWIPKFLQHPYSIVGVFVCQRILLILVLFIILKENIWPAHEKIGVVDSQWIVHKVIPSLGNQGEAEEGKAPWQGVRQRCKNEWGQFQKRLADADKEYLAQNGKG